MHNYQRQFIEFLLEKKALFFGQFTLKSGRISPYFFNSGLFNSGKELAILGNFYAEAIAASALTFDVFFGPAYKGIPLVCASAIAYATRYANNISYAFNRKEAKDHGEGGDIVGADISGKRVLIIDDVITAGTAIQESVKILQRHQASLVAVVIALDRQERGSGAQSAITEIEQQYRIPVISIITFENLIDYLQEQPVNSELLASMLAYR